MTTPETESYARIAPLVDPILQDVPRYSHYGSSQDLAAYLEELTNTAHDGVEVTQECVGEQQTFHAGVVPLMKTVVDLGGDGITVFQVGGVHSNELVYRRTQQYTNRRACQDPESFRRLGIRKLISLDADQNTTEQNDWHLYERAFRAYLGGAWRGREQPDWDYPPLGYNDNRPVTVPGCIAAKHIIDIENPEVFQPQHNAGVGSYFAYAFEGRPGFAPRLSGMLRSVYPNVDPSPTDYDGAVELAKGVYAMPSWGDVMRSMGKDLTADIDFAGDNSLNYVPLHAERVGTGLPVAATVDAAYFLTKLIGDPRLSGLTAQQVRERAIVKTLRNTETTLRILDEIEAEAGTPEAALQQDTEFYATLWQSDLETVLETPLEKPDQELTVGEVVEQTISRQFYGTVPLGMLANLSRRAGSPHHARINSMLRREVDDLNRTLELTPAAPRQLVQTQVGVLLVGALSFDRR